MQFKARIEIIMTPEGAIASRIEGVASRALFNMMVETAKQDILKKFAEAESGGGGPSLIVPEVVPMRN